MNAGAYNTTAFRSVVISQNVGLGERAGNDLKAYLTD